MAPELLISALFDWGGPVRHIQSHGQGLINDTFVIHVNSAPPRRAILQRVNAKVFPQPVLIMRNLRMLMNHIQTRAAHNELRLPEIIRARDGQDYVLDAQGNLWRALSFIEDTRTLQTIHNAAQASAVGNVLGQFHALLHDIPCAQLHETLPDFHIAPHYLARLNEVHARRRDAPESNALRQALDFVAARRPCINVLEDAKRAGRLPLRVTHGDPKLNNMLFDLHSDQAVSLIDLDTIQPGLIHYDLGDCLRSCCNTAGEAPQDLAAVRFDLDLAQAILEGYCTAARGFLTPADYAHLYAAIHLLPLELGIRFLTDHLEDDIYFKTTWRGQNLYRAQVQFRLTTSVEHQERPLRDAIANLAPKN